MAQTAFQDKAFASLCLGIDHLYSDGQFCDLVITIGNNNFSCHRLVLAAVSGFFQSSLMSTWHESSTGFVNINHEDVTSESFHFLLDIIYRGKNVITMATVMDVLKMSIFLRVKFLEEYCEQYLSDNMSPETYLGTWQFAERRQLMTLANNAARMAASRFDEVAKCGELVQLPRAMLLSLLSFLQKVKMDDLCRAIFRWAEEDVEERKRHLGEFLPFIDFTQLSPTCLNELIKYFHHPFRDYVFDYISEGMTFNLQGLLCHNVQIQRQLRAQQEARLFVDIPGMKRCAVIVGGIQERGKPLQDVTAVPLDTQDSFKMYALSPLQEACGVDFATCVWRNGLYISGGCIHPKYFAVYKPGYNIWETLPSLPQDREKHTMAAIDWTIYVMGGVSQRNEAGKGLVTDILSYNTRDKDWKNFSFLQTAVKDAASTTLGHRIYVFGGQDIAGHNTDVVQCVDTLTGCVYTAGHLPTPTFGARALSNGGTIFVTRPDGDVLQMKENISLADQVEKTLAEKKTRMGLDSASAGHGITLAEQGDSAEITVNGADNKSIVHFKVVGTFPNRQHFGTFLQGESVVVCGGEVTGGEFLNGMVRVNYSNGTTTKQLRRLLQRMACFGLDVLNIPQEFLSSGKAIEQPFEIGDKVKLTPSGINSFMGGGGLRRMNYVYTGPPRDGIGIITAKNGDGSWSVNFEGRGVVNITDNHIQPSE